MTITSAGVRCFVMVCATLAACGGEPDAASGNTNAAQNESGHAGTAGRTGAAGSLPGSASSAGGTAAEGGRAGTRAVRGTPSAGSSGKRGDAPPSDAATPPVSGAAAPDASVDDWKLVWSDEFDGPKGMKLDPSRWVYETGGSGWGNNQLEYDSDRAENASLDGNGELAITAIKESYMGKSYTSVRLKTQGKFEHLYGRYEIRMRIPFGQGMWPAFWMMGVDPSNVGWPTRGEIDIMENIGREPDTIHGTLHGPGYSGGNGIGAPSKLAMGQHFPDDYHVFAIEWEQNVVRWYVDGKLYQTRTPTDLPKGSKWVYDHPFFILLNLAVGGQWPGNPDASTTFPQTMQVDYVRVYDRG